MTDDSNEPIRKKGFILNFQTRKLQEIQDKNIVIRDSVINFLYFHKIELKYFSDQTTEVSRML